MVGEHGRASLTEPVLPRSFYQRSALEVAPDLLGCDLVCDAPTGSVRVRLVEVEAYLGSQDPGSHAFRGPTRRNATMFGPAGHLYVYFTYGMHWCINVVCATEGVAEAVLLRAAVVVEGIEHAQVRRPASSARDLARGPARLSRALGIDGSWDGADLLAGPVRILASEPPTGAVESGPRVGVAGPGGVTPWRFWLAGVPEVSVYRPSARPGSARRDR